MRLAAMTVASAAAKRRSIARVLDGSGQCVLSGPDSARFAATKAALRLMAFQWVGMCVKQFLIARHRRKWVVYVGPDNPRRKAWLQSIEDTIKNFPKPNVG